MKKLTATPRKSRPAATEIPAVADAWVNARAEKEKRSRAFLFREYILAGIERDQRAAAKGAR